MFSKFIFKQVLGLDIIGGSPPPNIKRGDLGSTNCSMEKTKTKQMKASIEIFPNCFFKTWHILKNKI